MEDDYMSNEDYGYLEHYLEIGAIEVEGVDSNGELIFSINENAKDLAPELWQAHQHFVDESLIKMYQDGLIDIEYDENLKATINMTDEAKKIAREYGILPVDDE